MFYTHKRETGTAWVNIVATYFTIFYLPYTKISIYDTIPLKGPKCEIFGFGFLALFRPIWIGDLGTRPKNY